MLKYIGLTILGIVITAFLLGASAASGVAKMALGVLFFVLLAFFGIIGLIISWLSSLANLDKGIGILGIALSVILTLFFIFALWWLWTHLIVIGYHQIIGGVNDYPKVWLNRI